MTNGSEAPHVRAAGAAELRGGVIVAALALLLSTQPVSTDLYLPGLPALALDLHAHMAGVQLTMSALLLSFGLGQLILGPTADRFGRRPVLLGGLALYVAAALGCASVQTIQSLVAWRALEGFGVAAAVVCARAMVRDLYRPGEGARVMSKALTGLGLFALSSPLLGGVLANAYGWRASMLATALFGSVTFALIALALPETAPRLNPRALHLATLWANWRRIGAHPAFRAWALLVTCTYGGLLAYLAGSSFVFINVLGTSKVEYGLFLAGSSVCYVAGTFVCRHWLLHHGLQGAVKRGASFTLAGGVLMVVLAAVGLINPWAIALPQWLYSFGHGVHQPCGQAAVVAPFPDQAGTASALSGFILAAGAVAVGAWLGLVLNASVWPLVATIAAFSVFTATVAWTLVQRHGALK